MRWFSWVTIAALAAAGCAEGKSESTERDTGTAQGGGGGESSVSAGGAGGGEGGAGASGGSNVGGGGNGGMGGIGGLTYTGTIINGFDQTAISGAAVCGIDPSLPCVMTDALGAFTYPGIPEDTRVRVGVSKDLFFPVESLIDTTTTDGTLTAFMVSQGIIQIAVSSLMLGYPFDDTKPAIAVVTRDLADVPVAGYSISLNPPTGEQPLFLTDDGASIDPLLTATSAAGIGFVVNADVGMYTLTVSGPAVCNAAYIVDNTNQHTAPLINPALFVIVFDCQ